MLPRLYALLLLGVTSIAAQPCEPRWESLDRRATRAWSNDAKFGILIHWSVYSVPAYAPVLSGKLAYGEWPRHAITEEQKAGANPVDAGSWDFHRRVYGADFPSQNFAPMLRAELFDPIELPDVPGSPMYQPAWVLRLSR